MGPTRVALSVVLAAGLAGCGSTQSSGDFAAPVQPTAKLTVSSALVKRGPSGELVTALRGTADPGATVGVSGKETQADETGHWALRTSYDRRRKSIPVQASADWLTPTSTQVTQPRRPKVSVTSSTGATTITDVTLLKGRIAMSRGSVRGVRVTVNGAPAAVVGSRWSKVVTVRRGTRRFTVKAGKRGADGGSLSMSKTRKLSPAERAARAAAREAKRQAVAAAREAKAAARKAKAAERRAAAAPAASDCDPNYSGACLDPNASDYDCAGGSGDGPEYVNGPVQVVGSDPFDLDRDGDGVGCES